MKKGDIVAVTFLDHVQSPKEAKAERFVVYGRLLHPDKRCVIVGSWVYAAASRNCDHNTNTYTLLRSAIQRIDVLQVIS